jgi:iron complex outermembrane receptor protein
MSATLKNAIRAVNRTALMLGSISTLAISSAAFAQEEGALMEEIEVTGIRGALKQAIDTKRFSNATVDSVSAEDVGKFPDSDVGQALGRIPGVTVGRAFGQGSSVSIRGAAPNMTLTQLNGQNVASTGWFDQTPVDRSFNYSLMPSEMVGGIDVYKSSQADLNDGGIGGTVIVKTRKPLDMDANTVFASISGSQGTISDELSPEVSGLYSWKNDSETFGVLVAGAYEDSEYIRQGTEADYRWWGDVAPSSFHQNRERTAFDVAVQWAPTDALSFSLHGMSLDLQADNANTSLYLFTDGTFADDYMCNETNASGTCTNSTTTNSKFGDLMPGWSAGNPENETFIQTWGRRSEMSSDTIDLSVDFEGNGYTISGAIGQTKADGGTQFTTNYQYFPSIQADDTMSLWEGNIDATGKQIKINNTMDPSLTLDDLGSTVSPQTWATTSGPSTDEELYAQVDVEFELDWGIITAFKTGARMTDHDVERRQIRGTILNPITVDTASLYSGTMEVGQDGFKAPKPDLDAMISNSKASVDSWTEMKGGHHDLNEENTALYGMFTFEGEGVRGNFGVRYVSTDVTRDSYYLDGSTSTDIADNNGYSSNTMKSTASYDDVLPSINIAFDVSDDVIVRASASQNITRPNYDDMLVTTAGFMDGNDNNQSIKQGTVDLMPMKASLADVGVEWYYGEGNMVSATYFIKSINDFVAEDVQLNQQIGLVDPNAGVDNWQVASVENGSGANIKGIELQMQHAFDSGFGVAANYTYTDSEVGDSYSDNVDMFTESSEHAYNLVGYWENDTFSARAAYNWRSEYMIREGAFYYGNRMHDDFGSLDLSFGMNVTDSIALSFEVVNLLEEDDVQFGAADAGTPGVKASLQEGFPAWSFEGEAIYKLGASFQF